MTIRALCSTCAKIHGFNGALLLRGRIGFDQWMLGYTLTSGCACACCHRQADRHYDIPNAQLLKWGTLSSPSTGDMRRIESPTRLPPVTAEQAIAELSLKELERLSKIRFGQPAPPAEREGVSDLDEADLAFLEKARRNRLRQITMTRQADGTWTLVVERDPNKRPGDNGETFTGFANLLACFDWLQEKYDDDGELHAGDLDP